MRRYRRALLCLLAVILWTTSSADAQHRHDFQVWNSLTLQSPLKEGSRWVGWTDVHARRSGEGTTLILRPGVGLKIIDCLTAHVGYAWVPAFLESGARLHEHRLWQHFLWTPKWGNPANLLVRMRLEQRWIKGGNHAGHRLRWMVRGHWSPPDLDAFLLVAWDEVFVQLNDTDWNLRRGYDQNRLFVGLGFRTKVRLRVEVGYLAVHLRRTPDNRVQHVLALNLFY